MPHPARAPRKQPSQRRSELTVEAILEAAARIFATDGLRGATTGRVAGLAGVSVGSLYQYFPNKVALLAGVKQRHLRSLFGEIEAALAQAEDLESGLRAAVRINAARSLEARPLLLLFADELPARLASRDVMPSDSPPAVAVRRFLHRHRWEIPGRDPAVAAVVVVELVDAVTRARLIEAPSDLEQGVLERELMSALLLYLRGRP